jgi:hypothetical protein
MIFAALILLLAFAEPTGSDIAQRLARWKTVQMPYDSSALDARQRQVVDKLAAASRFIESIYWQQAIPTGWRYIVPQKIRNSSDCYSSTAGDSI